MPTLIIRSLLPVLSLAALSTSLSAQGTGGAAPPGLSREQMWFAPTAEDWKKPCLIKWQRTWEDAQAVSKETGKPLLVVVNMDGEIASEHYAGVRYRQPEIAKLYEPYVCVIASVYRHSPRDFDEAGQRVLCPRFGTVTCGEHITIEPILYEKYFEGQRVAPRHIGVELDQKETYDIFYAWDTDTIFNSLKKGIADRPQGLVKDIRGDRPILDRVLSADSQDRAAVESAYASGDPAQRKALLEAASKNPDLASVDLLRLAVFGFDDELSKLARVTLAKSNSPNATELISEALRVPMPESEREALVTALNRLGDASPRAKTLSVVYRGLTGRSETVDVAKISQAMDAAVNTPRELSARTAGSFAMRQRAEESIEPTLDSSIIEQRIALREATLKSQDPIAHCELAEAQLALALKPEVTREFSESNLKVARTVALAAEKVGAPAARTSIVLCVAAYYLGDRGEARRRSEVAVTGLGDAPTSWNAMVVLGLFTEARRSAITRALAEKKDWPGEWLTDVHSAYALLAKHPFGDETQVGAHFDFLKYLAAHGEAAQVLDAGLARYPKSGLLHNRLRSRILEEKGVAGLEPTYSAMLAAEGAPASLWWFAGYASCFAAEFHRRSSNIGEAWAAYDRGIDHYDAYVVKDSERRATADREVAVALGSKARLAYEQKDDARAVKDLLASFARDPSAAATQDGLNLSAVDTAKVVLTRLKETNQTDLAAELDAALKKLDPKLLELPAYERGGPARTRPANRRQGGNGGNGGR